MPYPGSFHRLVLIGNLYSDTFNTSLSIVPTAIGDFGPRAPVNATLLEDVADVVGAWWTNATVALGASCISAARLTSIKLNRIDASGHYQDPETFEHIYPSPLNSGISSNEAPQLAVVATLRTAIPRGRGSKGRMYLPPTLCVTALGTDGRSTVAQALAQAQGVSALFESLNSVYSAQGAVGVASDAGAGAFQVCTEVSVGRVPDTIRSRRNKQDEDYQTVLVGA